MEQRRYDDKSPILGTDRLTGFAEDGNTYNFPMSGILDFVANNAATNPGEVLITFKDLGTSLQDITTVINSANQFDVRNNELPFMQLEHPTEGIKTYILKSGVGTYGSGGRVVSGSDLIQVRNDLGPGQIDHDQLLNFVENEHVLPDGVSIAVEGIQENRRLVVKQVNGHTVESDVPSGAVFTDTQNPLSDSTSLDSSTTSASSKAVKTIADALALHIADTSNPHNVQASQISDFQTEVSQNVDVQGSKSVTDEINSIANENLVYKDESGNIVGLDPSTIGSPVVGIDNKTTLLKDGGIVASLTDITPFKETVTVLEDKKFTVGTGVSEVNIVFENSDSVEIDSSGSKFFLNLGTGTDVHILTSTIEANRGKYMYYVVTKRVTLLSGQLATSSISDPLEQITDIDKIDLADDIQVPTIIVGIRMPLVGTTITDYSELTVTALWKPNLLSAKRQDEVTIGVDYADRVSSMRNLSPFNDGVTAHRDLKYSFAVNANDITVTTDGESMLVTKYNGSNRYVRPSASTVVSIPDIVARRGKRYYATINYLMSADPGAATSTTVSTFTSRIPEITKSDPTHNQSYPIFLVSWLYDETGTTTSIQSPSVNVIPLWRNNLPGEDELNLDNTRLTQTTRRDFTKSINQVVDVSDAINVFVDEKAKVLNTVEMYVRQSVPGTSFLMSIKNGDNPGNALTIQQWINSSNELTNQDELVNLSLPEQIDSANSYDGGADQNMMHIGIEVALFSNGSRLVQFITGREPIGSTYGLSTKPGNKDKSDPGTDYYYTPLYTIEFTEDPTTYTTDTLLEHGVNCIIRDWRDVGSPQYGLGTSIKRAEVTFTAAQIASFTTPTSSPVIVAAKSGKHFKIEEAWLERVGNWATKYTGTDPIDLTVENTAQASKGHGFLFNSGVMTNDTTAYNSVARFLPESMLTEGLWPVNAPIRLLLSNYTGGTGDLKVVVFYREFY